MSWRDSWGNPELQNPLLGVNEEGNCPWMTQQGSQRSPGQECRGVGDPGEGSRGEIQERDPGEGSRGGIQVSHPTAQGFPGRHSLGSCQCLTEVSAAPLERSLKPTAGLWEGLSR